MKTSVTAIIPVITFGGYPVQVKDIVSTSGVRQEWGFKQLDMLPGLFSPCTHIAAGSQASLGLLQAQLSKGLNEDGGMPLMPKFRCLNDMWTQPVAFSISMLIYTNGRVENQVWWPGSLEKKKEHMWKPSGSETGGSSPSSFPSLPKQTIFSWLQLSGEESHPRQKIPAALKAYDPGIVVWSPSL